MCAAHCDACKKVKYKSGCVIRDNATEILDQLIAAGVIVMASPIYCWSFTGCMSSIMDRTYSLLLGEGKNLLAGKKFVGLFTSGGDHFDGMELCVTALKHFVQFANADYVGTISAAHCKDPSKLKKDKHLSKDINQLVNSL